MAHDPGGAAETHAPAGTILLLDGTKLPFRPITPADVDLERGLFAALSEETRYRRFLHPLRELSPWMLDVFTHAVPGRDLALAAVHELPAGKEEFVAVARYSGDALHESAEFALVVADAWQGRGVGYALMQQLIAAARESGFRRLTGTVLEANPPMLELMASLGFSVMHARNEPGQLAVSLNLQ